MSDVCPQGSPVGPEHGSLHQNRECIHPWWCHGLISREGYWKREDALNGAEPPSLSEL